MKKLIFLLLLAPLLALGLHMSSQEPEGETAKAPGNSVETDFNQISGSYKLTYSNLAQTSSKRRQNRSWESKYWIDEGNLRKVESKSVQTTSKYFSPKEKPEMYVFCRERCYFSEKDKYIVNGIFDHKLKGFNDLNQYRDGEKEFLGEKCKFYSVTSPKQDLLENRTETSNFLDVSKFEVCIDKDENYISQLRLEGTGALSREKRIFEAKIKDKEYIENFTPKIPVATSIESCESSKIKVLSLREIRGLKLNLLKSDKNLTIEKPIEEPWKPQTVDAGAKLTGSAIVPVVNGEQVRKGSSACLAKR